MLTVTQASRVPGTLHFARAPSKQPARLVSGSRLGARVNCTRRSALDHLDLGRPGASRRRFVTPQRKTFRHASRRFPVLCQSLALSQVLLLDCPVIAKAGCLCGSGVTTL